MGVEGTLELARVRCHVLGLPATTRGEVGRRLLPLLAPYQTILDDSSDHNSESTTAR